MAHLCPTEGSSRQGTGSLFLPVAGSNTDGAGDPAPAVYPDAVSGRASAGRHLVTRSFPQLEPWGGGHSSRDVSAHPPARLSPVSTEAPHGRLPAGGQRPGNSARVQQGPGQMPVGTPTETPLLSTSRGRDELQQLHTLPPGTVHRERTTGLIAVGFVGMLPWDNLALVLHTS